MQFVLRVAHERGVVIGATASALASAWRRGKGAAKWTARAHLARRGGADSGQTPAAACVALPAPGRRHLVGLPKATGGAPEEGRLARAARKRLTISKLCVLREELADWPACKLGLSAHAQTVGRTDGQARAQTLVARHWRFLHHGQRPGHT